MSKLLVPGETGFVDARLATIEKRLQERDRRLFLTIGRVVDRYTKRVVAEKVEVRWRADDGKEHFIGSWDPEETERIHYDIARLDQEATPADEQITRIEKHNEEKNKAVDDQYRETVLRMMDHYMHAHREHKDFFGQAGV